MADLPAEPGWYRLTGSGWEHVDDAAAEAEIDAGNGRDFLHVGPAAPAEDPLF